MCLYSGHTYVKFWSHCLWDRVVETNPSGGADRRQNRRIIEWQKKVCLDLKLLLFPGAKLGNWLGPRFGISQIHLVSKNTPILNSIVFKNENYEDSFVKAPWRVIDSQCFWQFKETVHELVTSLTTNQATIWKAMSNNRYPISSSSNGGGMNGNGRQNVVNPDGGGGGLPLGPNAPTQPRQRRPPRATAPSPPSQVGSQ